MAEEVEIVEPDYEADQQIDVGVKEGPLEGTYSTVVTSVQDSYLTLEVPQVNGLYLPLKQKQEILLKHFREGATFEAPSSVDLRNDDRDTPRIIVTKPDEVKRIQRRDFVRVPCEIPVTVRVLELGGDGSGRSVPDSFEGTIQDISAGGVQVQGPAKLPLFTEVELIFSLPDQETRMDEIFARVVREPDADEGPYVMGVEFTSITENKRNDIIQYVYDRQIDIKD